MSAEPVRDVALCFIHSVEEAYDSSVDYKACGECYHVFRTEQEMLDAHNKLLADYLIYGKHDVPDAVSGDEVHSCPHCSHSF